MSGAPLNPYAALTGAEATHIGDPHAHATTQANFDDYYNRFGIRAHSITNYFPSAPTCPLDATFATVPGDVVCLPAAEFHTMSDLPAAAHLCGLGTTLSIEAEANRPWRDLIDELLDTLVWPDAGGVVIAHPRWSRLLIRDCIMILDHDDRILGIEARNDVCETDPQYSVDRRRSGIPMWDKILQSGRRCWGFFVTDKSRAFGTQGFSIVFTPTFTAEAVAGAYRRGEFYGAMSGTGLRLTSVEVDGHSVTVTTDAADEIRMICGGTVLDTKPGPAATFLVPLGAVYARFEAENAADTIYTQPIMYALLNP